jgi:ATP-dependent Clp protease ATP-binding subunit ClpB
MEKSKKPKRLDAFSKLPKIKLKALPYKEEVTREDIAEVVAKWTGIPVMKMLQGEEKSKLEDELHQES